MSTQESTRSGRSRVVLGIVAAVLRTYSCPGADGRPAATRLVVEGADPAHVAPGPATAGGGVALTGSFEVVAVQPVSPGAAPECRLDLAAR